MIWFVLIAVAVIVGMSVVVGRSLNGRGGPPGPGGGGGRMTRQQKMDALKLSGALKNRKSNRN